LSGNAIQFVMHVEKVNIQWCWSLIYKILVSIFC
jgi:hypothetical protein